MVGSLVLSFVRPLGADLLLVVPVTCAAKDVSFVTEEVADLPELVVRLRLAFAACGTRYHLAGFAPVRPAAEVGFRPPGSAALAHYSTFTSIAI